MIIKREQAHQYLVKGNVLKRIHYSNLNGDIYTSYIYVASEPYEETLHNNLTLEAIQYRNVEQINGRYVFKSKQKRYFVSDIFNGTVELVYCSNPFIKEDEFRI